MPGFRSFLKVFLHHFVLAKLAPSGIRVKHECLDNESRLR